ncbi:MAG: hypothetical protein JW838_00545 [Spirochaetes bacterium]|nr:hypothetical protein [Spirochaetota bacterium]
MDKKTSIVALSAFVAAVALAIIIMIIMAAAARYSFLIHDTAGKYYRGRALVVVGGVLVCRREPTAHPSRAAAMRAAEEPRSFTFMNMRGIRHIEIIPDREEEPPEGWQPALRDYLGDYTINAAGNDGRLSLRAGKEGVYGTIRFPGWGKGATEYLKNVRIANGAIYFVRSVTTRQEQARLGASRTFVQVYRGAYYRSGTRISGHYTVDGMRKQWDAVKTR